MLKIISDAIIKPIFTVFEICLKFGTFSDNWKQGKIEPIFEEKAMNKNQNYRPNPPLPICSKVFQRIC